MTEPGPVAAGGGVGLLAVVIWWMKRLLSRIDDHDRRLVDIEKNMLSKLDLDRAEGRIMSAINDTALRTAERIAVMQSAVDKAHERIDEEIRSRRRE